MCPFWVKYDIGELARNKHKAVYVLQGHLKTYFSLEECVYMFMCLYTCKYKNTTET